MSMLLIPRKLYHFLSILAQEIEKEEHEHMCDNSADSLNDWKCGTHWQWLWSWLSRNKNNIVKTTRRIRELKKISLVQEEKLRSLEKENEALRRNVDELNAIVLKLEASRPTTYPSDDINSVSNTLLRCKHVK